MQYLAGIDLGTSGAKISLTSLGGSVTYGVTISYPFFSRFPGWAEQDPEDWWNAVCVGMHRLLTEHNILASDVRGVGFSGQMHGLVVLDSEKNVIIPAILHCDTRAGEEKSVVSREELIQWGILNPAFSGFQMTSLLWLKKHRPKKFQRIRHVLSPKDYVRYRLTGELGTEWTDASATLLFDVEHRCWSAPMLERIGLDPAVLSPVSGPCDLCGTVTSVAAQETGLAKGTPVSFGGADQPMQALGNGVLVPGEMTCTVGSGGQLFLNTRQPWVNPDLNTHTFCNVEQESWYQLGAMLTAGTAFQYLAGLFYPGESWETINHEVEDVLDETVQPIFLPYLNGERSPHMNESLRGLMFGMTLECTRAHYMRAAMEGVCFAMRDMMEVLNHLGAPEERMVASGGYTRSPVWMQMMATILGRDLCLTENRSYQASVGAAITAGVGTGIYKSLREGVSCCVHFSGESVNPDPARKAFYEERYAAFRAVFNQCYGKNQKAM